ncbi:hypothetical protein WEI85_15150 [Actinomycetes bacterium KLBMP 9797]
MTDAIVVHHTMLPATVPHSFELSLRAMSGFAPCSGDQQVVDGRVRKAFLLPGEPDTAIVAEVGPGLELTVYAARPPDPDQLALVERDVSRWLSLDDDMSDFLAAAAADPAMGPILDVARGLHQVRFPSLAEGAAYFTLTQRSTSWFAAARKRRLAVERGPRLVVEGVTYTAFPSLVTVATLTDGELLDHCGNQQRASRVREVVEGVAALDEHWLRTGPHDEVRRALLDVPGIGPFTAHGLLLRVLGRPDDAPLDLAQFEAAARALYGEPAPSPAELRAHYGPWVGWWAYYARTALPWLAESARERDPVPAAA